MKTPSTDFRLAIAIATALSARSLHAAIPLAFPTGDTEESLLDTNWKFQLGDTEAAKDSAFVDSAWRTLDLPHDWSVEGAYDQKWASCTAWLPCGIAWYRKTLSIPTDAKDKSIRIRFDGIMNHATVYCNGQQVGERPYGYSSFTCELTPAIKIGADNIISVRVDHEQFADSRWYAGSGIYRDVHLLITDKIHVDTNGTFVTTPQVSADAADIQCQTTINNESTSPAEITVDTIINDANHKSLANLTTSLTIAAGASQPLSPKIRIPNPALWSPANPAIYTLHTTVKKAGAIIDEYDTPFGIRSCIFDPAKGFSINGQSMKLKGVCLHIDAGALGDAVPIQVWQYRLKLLQDAGVNAIRCSHNPPAPEFLDLCDRMGFLVMDEAFDEWIAGKHKWVLAHNAGTPGTDGYHSDFDKWADTDIKDMIVRDRNHPSIIMWSIGNEIDYNNDPFPPNSPVLPPIAARLIKDVKSVDTTRPVTAACAFPATNLYKQLLDIEGYNYMERLYPGDHAADPTRIIFGSENNHALTAWQAVAQNDFIAGQFLWTGIDYLGEAGAWPSKASGAGLITLANFPKNQYYFRQSLWSDTPMVYLSTTGLGGGGGRGRGRGGASAPGTPITITCFTNCDSVELFKDGQSLGSKPHNPGDTLTWPVDFSTGSLKAVGKKGTATTTFELKKAGAAAKLVLLPNVKTLAADGRDTALVEVQVTDKDGTLIPDSANLITCELTGPARILGIENGNISSIESNKSLTHTTFQGRLMIYLQSQIKPGDVTLSISAPGLESAAATLSIR